MNPILAALPVLSLCAQTSPPSQHTLRGRIDPAVPGKILVSGFESDAVHRYRASDGKPRGSSAVNGAQSIVRGPDGLLYICAEETDRVVRHDPATLDRVDTFVWDDPLGDSRSKRTTPRAGSWEGLFGGRRCLAGEWSEPPGGRCSGQTEGGAGPDSGPGRREPVPALSGPVHGRGRADLPGELELGRGAGRSEDRSRGG